MSDSTPAPAFQRKLNTKFALRRWLGELYVGKRMKRHSLARLLPLLAPPSGGRVLEVGSEDASFTEWFDRLWPQATVEGLELDPAHALGCAAWAEAHRRSPKLSFRQGSILEMTEVDLYDRLFCLDVLGYIADDRGALARFWRALRPGGLLVIHQPHPEHRTFTGVVHHVTPEMAGEITQGHLRHGYRPEELTNLLPETGFVVEKLQLCQGLGADLAHRLYLALEHPAFLRILALPLLDLLWWLDYLLPQRHGNTVLALARKPEAARRSS